MFWITDGGEQEAAEGGRGAPSAAHGATDRAVAAHARTDAGIGADYVPALRACDHGQWFQPAPPCCSAGRCGVSAFSGVAVSATPAFRRVLKSSVPINKDKKWTSGRNVACLINGVWNWNLLNWLPS